MHLYYTQLWPFLLTVQAQDQLRIVCLLALLAHGHSESGRYHPLKQVMLTYKQSVQAKDANGLQKALANRIGNYQVVEDEAGPGQLQNVVDLAPFLRVRAIAGCEADRKAPARDKTLVNITEARVELFGLRCASFCQA